MLPSKILITPDALPSSPDEAPPDGPDRSERHYRGRSAAELERERKSLSETTKAFHGCSG